MNKQRAATKKDGKEYCTGAAIKKLGIAIRLIHSSAQSAKKKSK
jgi:hypothetical protein